MALDLDKKVYQPIQDGQHTLTVTNWALKVAKNEEQYIELTGTLNQSQRVVKVALFEKGLEIATSNLAKHFDLEDISISELLNHIKGKTIPAYHETVKAEKATYYNWHLASEPRTTTTLEDLDEDLELPAF